jgi:hypothetical protein
VGVTVSRSIAARCLRPAGFGGALLEPPFRTVFDEAGGAGVFQYGDGPMFPNNTRNRSNYWVAPIFTP